MHLVFGITGIKHDVDLALKWLETRHAFLPFEKDGKQYKQLFEIGLRPIPFFNLYELIFPKEYLDIILNTFPMKSHVALTDGKGKKSFGLHVNLIRKIMKLKKIPKMKKDTKEVLPFPKDLAIRFIGVGIKEDIMGTTEDGIYQEML